jgi:AcrR family transcriptional regulator
MPKKVDHHERRTLIADALVRVAAAQGLEAVSLRHVAAEAGVSAGMVQHYFRTKDEMMAFALAVVREHYQQRVTEAVESLGATPGTRTLLWTFLAALLPTDDERRADGQVALAFLAYSAVRPAAGTVLHADAADLATYVAGLIRDAQNAGEAVSHVDPHRAAAGLLAILEGLGVHILGGHLTAEAGLSALDAHLSLLFPPR